MHTHFNLLLRELREPHFFIHPVPPPLFQCIQANEQVHEPNPQRPNSIDAPGSTFVDAVLDLCCVVVVGRLLRAVLRCPGAWVQGVRLGLGLGLRLWLGLSERVRAMTFEWVGVRVIGHYINPEGEWEDLEMLTRDGC